MLNYKGLKGTLERMRVTDAQVEKQIDLLLDQHMKTTVITDRPSQAGDELVLDYAGTIDGVAFEGGSAQNQTLVLGSGMFIPGFEEQLLGKSAGDQADVRVSFPANYHVSTLAGQPAVFHCTIRAIRIREKYRADDTFAREVFHLDSFSSLEKALRDQLQSYIDRKADEELKNDLLDQVCANARLSATDEQIARAVDREMKSLEGQLARQKLTLAAYAQFTGKTVEQLREDYMPDAKKNLLRQQVIAEIAQIEKIEADEQSVADAITALCRENGMTIDQLQPYMTDEFQAAIVRSVITDKVLSLIQENAEITVVNKDA